MPQRYTKTHTNPNALQGHIANIQKRGGSYTFHKTAEGYHIEYWFPEGAQKQPKHAKQTSNAPTRSSKNK